MPDNLQREVTLLKEKAKDLSVLYVEDEEGLRDRTTSFLSKIFTHIDIAVDGKDGLDQYINNMYDIVITDIHMPKMNGLDLIRNIRKHSEKQEIIITSAYTDLSYFTESIKLGVTGYLIKPLNFNDTLKIIEQSLDKLQAFREVEMYRTKLEDMVDKRTQEVIELKNQQILNFEYAIMSLVNMIEQRDTYTGGHSERVAKYSQDIAKELGLDPKKCDLIYQVGILHDIGKIMTPDSILLKPGQLSEEEYSLIQDHVTIGYDILSSVPMYEHMADIVYSHHESYDGTGYPRSLKGKEIPFLARILTIADAFDAMTTNRIYKSRKNAPEAIKELKEYSGTLYDPEIIDSAINVLKLVDVSTIRIQEPISSTDDERFAYFFKDPLTTVYNHHYLDFILQKNCDEKNFLCLNIIYIRKFTTYNKKHGWSEGDVFLSHFASYLKSKFKDSQIFRIFGDDFIIVNNIHQEVDIDEINDLKLLRVNDLKCELKHLNLQENHITSYKELQEN